jgi:hypothetical protein
MSTPVFRLVLRLNAKRSGKDWIARCPAHEDHKPSLSISEGADGRALVKCHAGCRLDAVLAALGMTVRDLFPTKDPQLTDNNSASFTPVRLKLKRKMEKRFDWHACVEAFTQKHIEALAKWRGYSIEFCSWLKENGLVGLYDGCIAFPVHDRAGNVIAAHYRLKDGSWRYFPSGIKTRPLVIGNLVPGDRVQCFESTWDGLDYVDKSGERDGVIITRGAENGAMVDGLIPRGSTVYVWTQNDKSSAEWLLRRCAIDRPRLRHPARGCREMISRACFSQP